VSLLLTMTPELTTPAETNVVVMTDFPMLCCVTDWRNESLGVNDPTRAVAWS
jgi:hypothetical protein